MLDHTQFTCVHSQIIRDLVVKSDVLVENYIPNKLAELGLSYEDLSALNPRLVYCSITGFGTTGPYAARAAYDVAISAMGGLMHITGPQGGGPVKVGVAITDVTTGLYAHGAIMAALLARHSTGRGQHIDCSLLDCQVSALVNIGANYLLAGSEGKRWGTAHASIVPYQAFETANGHVIVGALNDGQFRSLCKRFGRTDLMEDQRFTTNPLRVKHREQLIDSLQVWLR